MRVAIYGTHLTSLTTPITSVVAVLLYTAPALSIWHEILHEANLPV